MMRPDLVEFDAEQLENIWALYRTHATVGTCVQAVRNTIFGGGVIMSNVGAFSESHAAQIANRALDWIFTTGIVPVTFEVNAVSGKLQPTVPVPESLKLFVRTTPGGNLEYEGQYQRSVSILASVSGGSMQAPKVLIWSNTDSPPTSTGKLVTAMTHLEESEKFVNYIKHRVRVAETLRSNPFHVSQSKAKVNSDQDGILWNVPDKIVGQLEGQRLEGMEQTMIDQHKIHCKHWGNPMSNPDIEKALQTDCKPREYFLSAERDMARPSPVGSAIGEMTQLIRQSEEKIYQLFGIPMGMFTSSGTSVQANYMQEFALNSNLRRVKMQVEDFLNKVYELTLLINPSTKRKRHGSTTAANKKKKTDNDNDDTVLKTNSHEEVATENGEDGDLILPEGANFAHINSSTEQEQHTHNILLPGTPCIRFNEIATLVDRGVVGFAEGAQLMRSVLGLPNLSASVLEKQRTAAEANALKLAREGAKKIEGAEAALAANNKINVSSN